LQFLKAPEFSSVKCFSVIDDAFAAAIAYAYYARLAMPINLLIVDFGAGKFEASIARITKERGMCQITTTGSLELGGRDFDILLVKYCLENCKPLQADLSEPGRVLLRDRLLTQCRNAKELLSSEEEVDIDCSFLPQISAQPVRVTRQKFEELCTPARLIKSRDVSRARLLRDRRRE
jgi:L1 cell adhesion molecule like protein